AQHFAEAAQRRLGAAVEGEQPHVILVFINMETLDRLALRVEVDERVPIGSALRMWRAVARLPAGDGLCNVFEALRLFLVARRFAGGEIDRCQSSLGDPDGSVAGYRFD